MKKNLLFAAMLVLCASNARAQSPGDLDNTFGGSGHVVSDLSAQNRYDEYAMQVLIQPDGKRVVVVDRYPYIQLVRFNTDGTYDNTYGDGGFSQAANMDHFSGPNHAAAIQSDGKIVVAGETPWNSTSLTDMGVARWDTNGHLDAGFGTQGMVTLDFGNYFETGEAVRIQADGKIVVIGEVDINNLELIGLTRLNTDGSLDLTYGPANTGKYVYGTSFDLNLTDVSFTPDGKLMCLCDNFDDDFVLVRFGPNGVIDTSFGVLGLKTYDLPLGGGTNQYHPFVSCLAIQSDGKLLIGGSLYNGVNSDMWVGRFTAAGSSDGTFHPGGYVTTHIGGSEDVDALVVQPDGKIVAAGHVFYGNLPTVFALARYMTNGDLDGSFGVQGTQITAFSGYDGASATSVALHADGDITAAGSAFRNLTSDVAVATYDVQGAPDVDGYPVQRIAAFFADNGFTQFRASVVQPDGKLVAAGYAWNGRDYDMVVARFNLDGTADATFGTGGSVALDFSTMQQGSGDELASAIALQPDGKIVVAGQFFVFTVGGSLPVARLNANGTLDPTFGTGGKAVYDVPGIFEDGNAALIQPDGKIVIAGSTNLVDFDFLLFRLLPGGALDPTFGTGGVVTTDWGYQDMIFGLALQSDGKLVATGNTCDKDSFLNFDFNTARYTSTGALDGTFGTGGRVTTDFDDGIDFAQAITLQSNGGVIVAGGVPVSDNFDFGLARYTPTGAADPLFGTGGATTTALGGYDIATAVGIEKDGKILSTGYSDQSLGYIGGPVDLALTRHSAGGILDPSFGSGGKVVSDLGGQEFGLAMSLYKRRIQVTGEQRIFRPFTATDKYVGLVATYLTGPPPADELIDNGIDDITNLPGVPAGTKNALNAKLNAALAALAIPDTGQACNNLQALLNQIQAQSGKKLTIEQAADLTADVLKIMATLRCSTQGQNQNAAIVDPMDVNPAAGTPTSFAMNGNSPNPFVGTTRISYQLPVPSKVSLRIYNVQGQVVATVIDRVEGPGFKSASWDASRMPAGVYFARLQAGTFKADRKLLLVR